MKKEKKKQHWKQMYKDLINGKKNIWKKWMEHASEWIIYIYILYKVSGELWIMFFVLIFIPWCYHIGNVHDQDQDVQ